MNANEKIRKNVELSGVKYWEVAARLNLHPSNLTRKLRHELPADEKAKILSIVNELRSEKERALNDG